MTEPLFLEVPEADDLITGTFGVPTEGQLDPRPIVQRLVEEMDVFQHLRVGDAVIMVLFRRGDKQKGGKRILGELCLPTVQGNLKPLFVWLLAKVCGGTLPDFIMILDETWWTLATEHQREALVFHELMHGDHAKDRDGELRFDDDGRPVYAIRAHDLEEFEAVVERYGAWLSDISSFAGALRRGDVN